MGSTKNTWRKRVAAGALVVAGVTGGGVLVSQAANAADGTTATSSAAGVEGAAGYGGAVGGGDPSQPQRSDEQLLTGDDATKARAAALAKYPGATVERVETDSDGVYEAHIVTADGEHVIVQMDASFAVTGTQTGGPGGGRGHGDGDGDGPASGTASGSETAPAA